MEDLEKKIEEYALKLSGLKAGFDRQEEEYYQSSKVKIYDLVHQVIRSEVAKQYWFDTLIEEVIENETFFDFASKCALKKYELGTREHTIATMSIKFGMGCSLTKQYWQQGLYTEEEVRDLLNKSHLARVEDPMLVLWVDKGLEFSPTWFEQNKKK